MSDAELRSHADDLLGPASAADDRAALIFKLERLTLAGLRARAEALGISDVCGHRGHRRTWIDAILGRSRMDVDGHHEGNPCVGLATVGGALRPVYESGSGARYLVAPSSGRKEYRVPPGPLSPLPGPAAELLDAQPVLRLRGDASTPALDALADDLAATFGGTALADRARFSREITSALASLPRHALQPHENAPMREAADAPHARERLRKRLLDWGLRERPVPADGNCQFSSLADQLYGSHAQSARVRALACAQLAAEPGRYAGFVHGASYEAYRAQMAHAGTWGDHVTLQAVADCCQVRICVVTTHASSAGAVLTVAPATGEADRAHTLWLSFFAEVHYQSIEPL
jgi:hypothetical protein